eukprot:1572771-Amphidinium_carterae.1
MTLERVGSTMVQRESQTPVVFLSTSFVNFRTKQSTQIMEQRGDLKSRESRKARNDRGCEEISFTSHGLTPVLKKTSSKYN